MLAPNDMQQFGAIVGSVVGLQNDAFLQNAAQVALPVAINNEPHLAITHHLTESRVQRARANNLPPCLQNGESMRRLFI
ncbi:hypothetical protein PF003_g34500 [Phytophthora fragariae]|nr:hypothetical protein PF003_g34500 [Phytophthora fragariae]